MPPGLPVARDGACWAPEPRDHPVKEDAVTVSEDLELLEGFGAREPERLPGGVWRAVMPLGELTHVPVVVSVCREPIDEDQVAIAVGLSVTTTCAAIVLVATAGRAADLEPALGRFVCAPQVPPIVILDRTGG